MHHKNREKKKEAQSGRCRVKWPRLAPRSILNHDRGTNRHCTSYSSSVCGISSYSGMRLVLKFMEFLEFITSFSFSFFSFFRIVRSSSMLAAVGKGDAKKLAELIRQDPDLKVNKDLNGNGSTLLHYACGDDCRSPVIPLLLAHPDIDVNLKSKDGWTPFYYACHFGNTSCVREMLKDSRVKVNEPNNDGYPPLWYPARWGHFDVIKWWIASGREMDFGKPGDVDGAKKYGKTEVVTLLERFKSDAAKTRHVMRVELGWYDEAAAKMFALVVFVSDGLLQVKDTTTTPAARFFSIAAQLPLELQMVLCYRVLGSAKEIIPGKDSEAAFKSLAETLLWSSISN